MNLNKVFLVGRLTNDVVLRVTSAGQSVGSFSVATNRVWVDKAGRKQESTEFHNIVVWGKQAELCNQYLAKGREVMVEGRLQTRSYQAQTGEKKYRTEVIAERVQFGPKSGSSTQESLNSVAKPGIDSPSVEPLDTVDLDEPAPMPSEESLSLDKENTPF
jgi:single-strand DNA-binding protein